MDKYRTVAWFWNGLQESHPKKWVLIKIIPLQHAQNTAISPKEFLKYLT